MYPYYVITLTLPSLPTGRECGIDELQRTTVIGIISREQGTQWQPILHANWDPHLPSFARLCRPTNNL